jgi:hypothetical protein
MRDTIRGKAERRGSEATLATWTSTVPFRVVNYIQMGTLITNPRGRDTFDNSTIEYLRLHFTVTVHFGPGLIQLPIRKAL